ncbi:MAG: T9SS type A sorting domain-containing protein [Bacteroidales bacterium]|nr:T9SS type A sorting domain-containing protein [Bacteroidales bacterium]
MKKTLTLMLSFLWALTYAQPQITQANLPLTGDQVLISICSGEVNPGNAGAMQTWDMSNLVELEEQFFSYIQPSTAPMADSFPNANLCAKSWLDDFSYYRTTPTSLAVDGYVVTINSDDTSVMVYDDPEQILQFPYSYNDNFVDNFSGISYIPSFGEFPFDGYLDFEADGYGTLILPNGTYENVVRYHFYREQTNYFGGFPAGTTSKDQWAWVSADYRFWLLIMEEVFDGISTTPLIWYDKNPYAASTGINSSQAKPLSVFPNPLKSGRQFAIEWNKTEPAHFALLRIDGSIIIENLITLADGPVYLNCPDLAAGLYLIRLETDLQYFTQKISVLN